MARLLVNAKGKVLDVGCADKWTESRLPPGCTYLGVDSMNTGNALYQAKPTLFADASKLPFIDESFDTVLLFEVLEHLAKPAVALAEICRVLKPDGLLIASVPFLYPIHDAPHDFQRYTVHGLERVLIEAGMRMTSATPRLDSISCAALLANLAIGGSAKAGLEKFGPGALVVPLMLAAIPIVNMLAVVLRPFASSWSAMTNGYLVVARPA